PHPNDSFTVIDNRGSNPVNGTFSTLPEGATVWDTNHTYRFRISYVGGDGNDVVLTGLPSAYSVTTTADSGSGSLRDALTQINAHTSHTLYPSPTNPNVDEIDFNIPTSDSGYHAPAASISVTSVSLTANVATLTTSGAVPFGVGQTITVAGLSNSLFDG